MRKKYKKDKNPNKNQTSFYFEDYLETNKKIRFSQKKNFLQDRVYLLFFLFFTLILIFSLRIVHISLNKLEISNQSNSSKKFTLLRRDIVDRNGELISRNIQSFHAAINPKLIKNKENFLINLRLNFPNIQKEKIENQIKKGKYFYLKKRINQQEKEKLWNLGHKAIIFETFQSRIYTHANLFSHIIGQVDFDNYGISGIEKYFDKELKNRDLLSEPLEITLDVNLQYLINKELNKALTTFNSTGAGALLMDVNTGEILSLVSLPNFDINKRANVKDKKYMNKITKGVYELGSIFKTFTVALALENKIVSPQTIIHDIPRSIECSKHNISDIKEFPRNLSVEDILIRSSNIGTLLIARKIGEKKFKKFIEDANLLEIPEFQLEEVGSPISFNWNKCKLETVSFGHGITTTPLQATSTYASLTNGGNIIQPTLIKRKFNKTNKKLISKSTSENINKILRKVVTDKNGTASLANIDGYYVGGKTGTSPNYQNKKDNLNTFISIFPSEKPKYVLLVMLENPKVAKDLVYNYRGTKIKASRNEAGWNSVYVAGKIIEKIGPILAIKSEDFNYQYVVEKTN
ncbi:MAG: penicillin-binding protein 2 [Pseudomonadota bacterium]|nr:penicillin-binding protein 2 [Pseudomonadota bacterium]